jgi:hypothetical protein
MNGYWLQTIRRVRLSALTGAAGIALLPFAARGGELTDTRVDDLLKRLVDPSFAARSAAELELAKARISHVEALEGAASREPEHAARIVALLERLFVGDSDSAENLRLARTAGISSVDVALTIFRIGDFQANEVTRAAELALERLAQQDSAAASYAVDALNRHALLRENRAIADIRAMGGHVIFESDPDPVSDVISSAVNGFGRTESLYAIAPPQPHCIEDIYILDGWTGGKDGLKTLQRIRTGQIRATGNAVTVYVVEGSGVTTADIEVVSRDFPGLQPINRGRATLGVSCPQISPNGCEVRDVIEGLAAERAGIRPGDVIRELDGEPIKNFEALVERLKSYKPGDVVSISVEKGIGLGSGLNFELDREPPGRRGAPKVLEVRLSSWSEMPNFKPQ